MNWRAIRKRREVELAVAWLLLPLSMFAVAFAIAPWPLLWCSLGNPLFELAVDGFQVIVRSDAVSRCIFFLLFTYCHMLLPTGLYYLRKDRRVSVAVLAVWVLFVGTTALKAIAYTIGKS